MTRLINFLLFCTLIATVALTSGCSTRTPNPNQSLIDKLSGQGPVVLSADNQYIDANLLLNREMETSPEMRGFVEHRGFPRAIQVEQRSFSPLFIHFYYSNQREYFTFEKLEGVYAIRGPIEMPSEKVTELRILSKGLSEPPSLIEKGTLPKQNSEDKDENSTEEDPIIAMLDKISEQKKADTKEGWKSPASSSDDGTKEALPEPSLQDEEDADKTRMLGDAFEATKVDPEPPIPAPIAKVRKLQLRDDMPTVSKNKRGDLSHQVVLAGENLEIISFWYTGDKDNAGRIARINKRSVTDKLNSGDSVIIPGYLLKTNNQMTDEAFEAVKEALE